MGHYGPGATEPGGFAPPNIGGFAPPPGFQPAPPTSNEAVLSLVLGIVGATVPCFLLGVFAFYFGVKARRLARERGEVAGTNATMGLIGMILGGTFGAMWVLGFLLYVGFFGLTIGLAIIGSLAGPGH